MPKFYCEYCGVYLTHSSPSGRKQHCRGRKHINNKIEYYNQLLIDQNQSGRNPSLKAASMNPFARPLLPNMPFNIPGMLPNMNPGLPNNLNPPHINLPGILPSNITSLPLLQNPPADGSKPQPQPWGPGQMPLMPAGAGNQMPSQPINMGQISQNQIMQGGQMPPGGQMGQMGQLPPGGLGMPPMHMMQQTKPGEKQQAGPGFMMNNLPMQNPGGTFIHPANVPQTDGGFRKV